MLFRCYERSSRGPGSSSADGKRCTRAEVLRRFNEIYTRAHATKSPAPPNHTRRQGNSPVATAQCIKHHHFIEYVGAHQTSINFTRISRARACTPKRRWKEREKKREHVNEHERKHTHTHTNSASIATATRHDRAPVIPLIIIIIIIATVCASACTHTHTKCCALTRIRFAVQILQRSCSGVRRRGVIHPLVIWWQSQLWLFDKCCRPLTWNPSPLVTNSIQQTSTTIGLLAQLYCRE